MRVKMRRITFILVCIMLLAPLSAATTTTQPSKTDALKADWNRTLCIALRVIQIISVGIAALLIMVAGLKYMSSEELADRSEARSMIIRVICILAVIAVAVQVVNYLVAGTNIGALDMDSCKDLFPTTLAGVPTTTTTSATTTTSTNGTTTTSVSTTSSTTTTIALSCTDPTSKYSLGGSADACQRASSINLCKIDLDGNGITDLDDSLGVGFSQCCCNPGAYANCC
jgi:hypothetical protein